MKKQPLLALIAGIGLTVNVYGQNIQPKSTLYWNPNSVSLISNHDRVNSFQDYCIVSENEIAFIENETGELRVYNTQSQKTTTSFSINNASLFLSYKNNLFYVLGIDNLSVYDVNGAIIKTISYQIPEEKQFAVERLTVINECFYIHLANGETYQLKEDGTINAIDNAYWLFDACKAKSEVLTNKQFVFSAVKSNKVSAQKIDIKYLGLPDLDLASAKIIELNNDKAYLDIELTSDNGSEPFRYMVVIDLSNYKVISKIEIPFVYSSYFQNQYKMFNGKLFYALSAIDGIYLYDLSLNNGHIALPTNCPNHFHFNENLQVVNDLEDLEESQELIGQNQYKTTSVSSITRNDMMSMAYAFRNKTWTASASNIANYCATLSGLKYRTPSWVSAGAKTSIPYKWGGFTSLGAYSSFVAQGKKCGNIATSYAKCGGTNHSSASDSYIIGLDCSGFVSRSWYQSTKYGTTNLSSISSSLGSATSTSPFNSQLRGDVINKAGSHVRMFVQKNLNGTGLYIEEANGGGLYRVFEASYSRTALSGYIVRRYNSVSGLKLANDNELNQTENLNVSIYPTITTDAFSVNTDVTDYNLSILNNLGQLVYTQEHLNGHKNMDVSILNAGIYFVNINKNNKATVVKIVKQ